MSRERVRCDVCRADYRQDLLQRHLATAKHQSAAFVKLGSVAVAPPSTGSTGSADGVPLAGPVRDDPMEKSLRLESISSMDCSSDSVRGVHASAPGVAGLSVINTRPKSAWHWIGEFYPWKNRERMELDLWQTHFGISDEAFSWLLHIITDSSFDSHKLWKNLEEYRAEQKLFPQPEVTERKANAVSVGRNKQHHSVIAQISLLETIRRLFADPLVRPTINIDARSLAPAAEMTEFLDSPFSKNPTPITDCVAFYVNDGKESSRVCVGEWAEASDGKETGCFRVLGLTFDANGALQIRVEHWQTQSQLQQCCRRNRVRWPLSGIRLLDHEIVRTTVESTLLQSAFIRKVSVGSVDSSAEFVARYQVDGPARSSCNFVELRQFAASVAQVPLRLQSGKFLWVVLYLDGEQQQLLG